MRWPWNKRRRYAEYVPGIVLGSTQVSASPDHSVFYVELQTAEGGISATFKMTEKQVQQLATDLLTLLARGECRNAIYRFDEQGKAQLMGLVRDDGDIEYFARE